MTTRRFEVTPVRDFNKVKVTCQPSEIIPLINITKDAPSPPPLPSSFTTINETNKPSTRSMNNLMQRLKATTSATDLVQSNETSSLPGKLPTGSVNLTVNREIEEVDSCYSTIHTMDASSFPVDDKFLQELRSKRRELREKGRHLSIDQRIALNRFQYDRNIIRAQDIFDVHFASNDDENTNVQQDLFNENTQEQIRNNIFKELDRQRIKQFHKHYRQLILGRALLLFITSVILFMSITLIYVVADLYDRANYFNANFEDNQFIPIIYDDTNES